MNDKVSIIVPSYKRHKNLFSRAIESLLNQSYENIEIVVIDDNGNESLATYRKELNDYIKKLNNPKIKYIQNPKNLGGALSRNEGIKNATGDYITFLDDDDEYKVDKIKNQIEKMIELDLDMSFTDLSVYNENKKLINYRDHNIKSFETDELFKYHLTHQITGTNTFMVKKSILEQINGFDNVPMGQEYFLMCKIIKTNCKIGYLKLDDIIFYRYDIETISTGPNKIPGEKNLYKYKKSHFDLLTFKEKQYIKCRHYAVMAVAYKRNKKYIKSFLSLIRSFLSNPFLVIKEALMVLKKRKNKRSF